MEVLDYNAAIIARFVDLRHFLGICEGNYEDVIPIYRGESIDWIYQHCRDELGKISALLDERARLIETQ